MKVVTELLAVGFLDCIRSETEGLILLLEQNKGKPGSEIDLRSAQNILASIERKIAITKDESFSISDFIKEIA